MKKKRVSVLLSENAINEVHERMLKEGYSLREKSRWIAEAIEDFLKLEGYQSLVETADLVSDFSSVRTESLYITSEIEDSLEQAIINVRKEYPALEGVKSLIVRASITRRLLTLGKRK